MKRKENVVSEEQEAVNTFAKNNPYFWAFYGHFLEDQKMLVWLSYLFEKMSTLDAKEQREARADILRNLERRSHGWHGRRKTEEEKQNDLVPHDCDVPEDEKWKKKWTTLYITRGE